MVKKIEKKEKQKERTHRVTTRKDKKEETREKVWKVRKMELYYCKNMYENKRVRIKLRRTVRYKITE